MDHPTSQYAFSGKFEDDVRSGPGLLEESGISYNGEFRNDRKNGLFNVRNSKG